MILTWPVRDTAVLNRSALLVEDWDPPVPMNTVLTEIDTSGGARADFEMGVVRITAHEYETALAVAARGLSPDRDL